MILSQDLVPLILWLHLTTSNSTTMRSKIDMQVTGSGLPSLLHVMQKASSKLRRINNLILKVSRIKLKQKVFFEKKN